MKLLSICIPTYNRPDKLKELYQSFLSRALEEYGNQIEVVVCDNSGDENARLNRASLGSTVCYYKNTTNIGFGGNLIRCVREATGEFIWIISDDDLVLWDGFKCLMDCLPCANDEGIDYFILPWYFYDFFGENKVCNRNPQNVQGITGDIDISSLVKITYRHFILFSTAVIRLEKNRLDWVDEEFKGNHMMQIPLFLSMLKPESKVRFLDIFVIEYKTQYTANIDIDIGYDIISMHNSLSDVIMFLEKEYDVNGTELLDQVYIESLCNILSQRVGFRSFKNGDIGRWSMLGKLGQHLKTKTIRTVILAFLVALPAALIRQPCLFYMSLNLADASGNLSIMEVISRFKTLSIREVITRYKLLYHLSQNIRTKQHERRFIKEYPASSLNKRH